jgi:hypothetical protein
MQLLAYTPPYSEIIIGQIGGKTKKPIPFENRLKFQKKFL